MSPVRPSKVQRGEDHAVEDVLVDVAGRGDSAPVYLVSSKAYNA